MPSIIPWVLDEDGSGTTRAADDSSTSSSQPCPPVPSPAVMHPYVECADGCRIGPVETVSFLCPHRDVCSGHRNLRWLRLVLYIMPSYSQVADDAKQQGSIERMMYDFWANDGGLFIGSSSEWLAVRGIGLKCGHISMFEGLGKVSGIGVDIHVWRMSMYFGWTSKMDKYNCEKSTRELESWFPRQYWGEMNELYAGLGQLLQRSQHKELVQRKLMQRARATKDKEVIRLATILLSIPKYH